MNAQSWLEALPPLPATAEEAYAQWTDTSGNLKPGPAQERIAAALKAQILLLERPVEPTPTSGGPVSAKDRALAAQITVFPDSAGLQPSIQAARNMQVSLEQKWRSDAANIEQHRLADRSALPACHNEAGAPSPLSIREVEERYAQQKVALAERYLAQFQPALQQLKATVIPRVQHGDTALAAWLQLRNAGLKTQLAPLARGAQSNALLDVGLVQTYSEEVSKLAARAAADKKALERVYAQAKGC
jgi:hypothetical protein